MLEVVCLKNDVYTQRFKAEHGKDLENEEKMTAKIEQIRDELFSMSFEETGKDLINKFRQNFQRLRDFMSQWTKRSRRWLSLTRKMTRPTRLMRLASIAAVCSS